MSDGPLARYREMIASGALEDDVAQRLALEKLQLLHNRLKDYDPWKGKRVARGFFGWGREGAKKDADLNGLYIYGGVGRGKSMLMDLFFDAAPVEKKRRVHFHAFMQEAHRGIHNARQAGDDDPIKTVAKAISRDTVLLCFDEMQITDITDAMIVGRLFEKLFKRGTVIVATSNRPPDDLYKNGLNRQIFLPFIAMLKEKLDLHLLESPTDYRQSRLRGREVYHTPLGPDADAAMDATWDELTGGREGEPLTLEVNGREVVVPCFHAGVGRGSFADLCARPLGPGDYLAIAAEVRTLMLDRVPRLGLANANEAKRFVTLIDALYEAKARLICSAAAEPEALYPEGTGAFEFERTASRLAEMRSEQWLEAV
ncbi:cell division protein ZapE [Pikeienuella piscinae]|uniref:Cell division protein ZapE n=1 Tax=Pikeienuella piscinae TaxID=2748098 RepID=A0A7L5BUF2_9RHOB|nr:cell division protein ZapE [Pikeienuella piscinae]QIE55425.1 cell division protein ZapE [Pikeienuella piscinae]